MDAKLEKTNGQKQMKRKKRGEDAGLSVLMAMRRVVVKENEREEKRKTVFD